jgi:predicted transcriptional regulator
MITAIAGTIYGMVKTTVYLDEAQAAALRRMAAQSGRSQAEIIRDAVARATDAAGPRRLHSVGAGEGTGEAVGRDADAILRRELGRSRR